MLILLVATAPGSDCACFQGSCPSTGTHKAVSAEHSCCSAEADGAKNLTAESAISAARQCCGMMGSDSPALATSHDLYHAPDEIPVNSHNISRSGQILKSVQFEQVAYPTRGPPFLIGLGTRYTYLFKRTFLI